MSRYNDIYGEPREPDERHDPTLEHQMFECLVELVTCPAFSTGIALNDRTSFNAWTRGRELIERYRGKQS